MVKRSGNTSNKAKSTLKTTENTQQLGNEIKKLRQEVAELKMEKEDLFEDNLQFKSILDNVHDVVFLLSPLGYIEYVSPNVEHLYNYKPEELIGKHIKKTTPITEVHRVLSVLARVLRGKIVTNFNINQIDQCGNIIPMEVNTSPVRKGKKIIAVQGIMRDLRERIKVEKILYETEEKHRILLEEAPLGIYYNDFAGTFLYANKRVEKITGYNREELVGKNFLKLKLLNPKDIIRAAALLTLNRLGRNTGPDEFILNRKDGAKARVEINTTIVSIDGEKVVLGLVKDITKRKRAEKAFKITDRELKTFIYKISHDLKGPLSSILGLINYEQQFDNATEKSFFNNVKELVFQMEEKLNALTQVSVIQQGELKDVKINFKKLIDKVLNGLINLQGIGEVTIKSTIKVSGSFYSDTMLLEAILQNLVIGGVKYRKRKGNSYVKILVSNNKQGIKLIVSDNGIGIKEKFHEKIFDMFYRANEIHNSSGLGLYVVKKAVVKLGGEIKVESKYKEGSKFIIILPDIKKK